MTTTKDALLEIVERNAAAQGRASKRIAYYGVRGERRKMQEERLNKAELEREADALHMVAGRSDEITMDEYYSAVERGKASPAAQTLFVAV